MSYLQTVNQSKVSNKNKLFQPRGYIYLYTLSVVPVHNYNNIRCNDISYEHLSEKEI